MRLTFEFPADTAVLENIGKIMVDASRNAGFNDTEIDDIQLAVDEACTNTIIHGLKEDRSKTPLDDRVIGGLGIFFIKELMDKVEYKIGEGGVKTLYMMKRRTSI